MTVCIVIPSLRRSTVSIPAVVFAFFSFMNASPDAPNDSFRRHALIFGAGAMLIPASGVLLLPLYVNYLSAKELGTLEIVNQIATFLCICFLSSGVYHATGTFYLQAKDENERRSVAVTVWILYLLAIALGSTLAVPLLLTYGDRFGVDDSRLLFSAVGGNLVVSMLEIPYVLMRGRMESLGFVVVTFLQFLIRVLGTIVAVAWFGCGVWGVVAMYWVSGLLFVVILYFREFRRGTVLPDWGMLGKVFFFAIPFLPGGICTFIQMNGDRFFLARYCGLDTVGVYSLAWKLAGCVAMLSALPMQRVWLVRQYEVLPSDDGPVTAGRWCSLITAAQIFVGLLLALFCRELLILIGKEEFWPAASLIPILVLADIFLYLSYFFEGPLFVKRRTGLKFLNGLIATTATVGLFILLIPRFGEFGAAVSTLLGYLLLSSGALLMSQRILTIRYEWGTLAWLFVSSVAVYLLARQVDVLFPPERIVLTPNIGERLMLMFPPVMYKLILLGVWGALVVRFKR